LASKPRVEYCEISEDEETMEVREYIRDVSPAPEPRTRRQIKTEPVYDIDFEDYDSENYESEYESGYVSYNMSGCNCVRCRYA
jgi:hypothetical protein